MAYPIVWQKLKDLMLKFSEYLPLSGGKMTGKITFGYGGIGSQDWENSDGTVDRETYMYAGDDQTQESVLVLRSSTSEKHPDSFTIRAGRNSSLFGNAGGELSWQGRVIPQISRTYWANGWYCVQVGNLIYQSYSVSLNNTVTGHTYNSLTITFPWPFGSVYNGWGNSFHDRFNCGINGLSQTSAFCYYVNDSATTFTIKRADFFFFGTAD